MLYFTLNFLPVFGQILYWSKGINLELTEYIVPKFVEGHFVWTESHVDIAEGHLVWTESHVVTFEEH